MSIRHWGPHFPDAASSIVKHWSIHFPDGGQDPTVLSGFGPSGVATLVLDLEAGFTVRHQWRPDIEKFRSGKENRASLLDAPKQFFSGAALLSGNDPRGIRAKLARFAAIGGEFLIGLAHEQLTLQADSSGTSVFVNATERALTDWNKPGQRVVVAIKGATGATSFVNAVIQTSSSGTIVLDVAPGAIGKVGGVIMPAFPVYFDPQQDFDRYPVVVEKWQLKATGTIVDFAPTLATITLFGGAVLTSRRFGAIGNSLHFISDESVGYPATGQIIESGVNTFFNWRTGVTTLGNLATLLQTLSDNWILTGSYNPSTVFTGFYDALGTGGALAGDLGTGATLTTYSGDGTSRPVWDYELTNDATEQDGVHAMTQIIDHGAKPYALGTADRADWKRFIRLTSNDRVAWQWFKKFTSTTKGAQKAFWLSTWRPDMTFVSKNTNTITVSDTDSSDLFAWWPDQRQHIEIRQADGTITRAKITAAVDNGTTVTLTIGVTISSSAVTSISWLELCRFESDNFSIAWSGEAFDLAAVARVVQQ